MSDATDNRFYREKPEQPSSNKVLVSGIAHAIDVLSEEVDSYDDDTGNPPHELTFIRGLIAHLNGTLLEADGASPEPAGAPLQGLLSIGLSPDLPRVALIYRFDSLEHAQAARSAFTSIVEGRAAPPPSAAPFKKARQVFAGKTNFNTYLLKVWFDNQEDLDAAFDLVEAVEVIRGAVTKPVSQCQMEGCAETRTIGGRYCIAHETNIAPATTPPAEPTNHHTGYQEP